MILLAMNFKTCINNTCNRIFPFNICAKLCYHVITIHVAYGDKRKQDVSDGFSMIIYLYRYFTTKYNVVL